MARINPLPGLHNCLSAHHSCAIISALAQFQTLLVLKTPTPGLSLRNAVPLPAGRVHAAAANHVIVTVRARRLVVNTPSSTYVSTQLLHFEERAIAAHLRSNTPVLDIAIGGYDGVFFTSVNLGSAVFHPLQQLSGTAAHKMVCVTISNQSLAAANLDGRVAVWHSYNAACDASIIVEPAPQIPAGDRVTDIMFTNRDNNFVVAWWSGALVLYNEKGCAVWAMYNPASMSNFCRRSGTFLVSKPPYIVACHGSGAIKWIDAEKERVLSKTLATDIKGFCCANGQLLLWDFETGLQLVPSPSASEFADACEPICKSP